MQIRIKENSWIAKWAARRLRTKRVAIVIGRTIYLWQTTKAEFLSNQRWVQHEMQHVYQYKKFGVLRFVLLYLLESIKNGYYNNRFEKEAREKETKASTLSSVKFI